MAFGFGPGSDMIKSYQSNRKQLGKKKSLKETSKQYKGMHQEGIRSDDFSEEDIFQFKNAFREKAAKERKQNRLLFITAFLFVFVVFYWVLFT
ncbi:hypothetical protein EV197_1954 [Aquimarina brevivitae]|uniref:Uncharacterized protein n=2 Tax=Aquimarina brevivitae TaxID=323412 RepID=A0A4Q7P0Q3_9FLAO|nr:hypothetical protein EV197_1954 [Aquimarina brevivitae]